jgi:hypothetical protein
MDWNEIVQKVTPYVVKIETPSGYGTGFLCFYNERKTLCAIATAYHVIAHADDWQEPIRIHHHASNTVDFVKEDDRFIYWDRQKDSAVMLLQVAKLELPKTLIQLRPIEDRLPIGVEVGWLGYPSVTETLCFFSGSVSAFQDWRHAYLIDGVAITGVSGGPVLYSHPTEGVQIVGSITAYMSNRARGEATGLSVAQDVSHFHEVAANIKSMDEARTRKAEEAEREKERDREKAASKDESREDGLTTDTPDTTANPRAKRRDQENQT